MTDIKLKGNTFKEQAEYLRKEIKLYEDAVERSKQRIKELQEENKDVLGQMFSRTEANENEYQIEGLKKGLEDMDEYLQKMRMRLGDLENAPIESVLDDIGPKTYDKPGTGVQYGIGFKTVMTPALKKALIAIALGFTVVGLSYLLNMPGADDEKNSGNNEANNSVVPFSELSRDADGGLPFDGKKYYAVRADEPSGDTGNEVCAKAGKSCVGYTALDLGVCLAFHPGAQESKDFNGSKAGFYCNGAPQGGICAKEVNTCHICPECNLNMDCDTVIGDLYRETFVECK